MQFRDLKSQYRALKEEMDAAIEVVLDSSDYIAGDQIDELERELADYIGVRNCVSCGNGTDALVLALKAWGVGSGAAVFVPDHTFFSSAESAAFVGAPPVFADVSEDTFTIDLESLTRVIEAVVAEGKLKPRAIVVVDLFGLPADYERIREIADRYGLYILEDCAQGFGGVYHGKQAGSFGDISTTSFFPAKPLGCYGDGGAVFTDNDEWAALIRSMRVHGKGSSKYDNVRIGMNSRLDTIQAAVLQVKLKAFREYELEDVNKVAARYTEALRDCVKVPLVPEGYYSSWASYNILLKDEAQRDAVRAYLQENGVPTMIYYPKGLHQQKVFEEVCRYGESLAVTTDICKRTLAIPVSPYLSGEDQDRIIRLIREKTGADV
ncbi:MAG: DegT/DnrJ/EryC1/StrS family aminotransferase [Lachnospiraceae bacterium]|nr:DegT/DnrJ/EryC1/StrS family aminotransferase [Lachnospiraceae bacterium]